MPLLLGRLTPPRGAALNSPAKAPLRCSLPSQIVKELLQHSPWRIPRTLCASYLILSPHLLNAALVPNFVSFPTLAILAIPCFPTRSRGIPLHPGSSQNGVWFSLKARPSVSASRDPLADRGPLGRRASRCDALCTSTVEAARPEPPHRAGRAGATNSFSSRNSACSSYWTPAARLSSQRSIYEATAITP
jgi:hypothetical protein